MAVWLKETCGYFWQFATYVASPCFSSAEGKMVVLMEGIRGQDCGVMGQEGEMEQPAATSFETVLDLHVC